MALRIRPLKREELTRGYKAVATKVDDKVRFLIFFYDFFDLVFLDFLFDYFLFC